VWRYRLIKLPDQLDQESDQQSGIEGIEVPSEAPRRVLFPIIWSPVYAWLFNNAGGSVLIVMLFHNMNNAFSSGFVGQMFSGADSVNQAWLRLGLWLVVTIVVVVVYGPEHLSREHRKQEEPVRPEVTTASPRVV
jgi:hypothetical protein